MSTSATSGVAGRYASALFELADNAKSLDQVAQDLDSFRKLLSESADLSRLVAHDQARRDRGHHDGNATARTHPPGLRATRSTHGPEPGPCAEPGSGAYAGSQAAYVSP